jgi:hypothetical protein
MSDDSRADDVVVTSTMLDEIAWAISELGFHRQLGELAWPDLEPETKTLKDLIWKRVASIENLTAIDFCELTALLILEGMVAQHLHDLRLALQSQPPFAGNSKSRQ